MDRIRLWVATLAFGLPAITFAGGSWFAGVDVGDARVEAKIDEYAFLGDTTARSRGSTTGYRLHGGRQFGRFFALEAAYVDFGDIESHFDPDNCPYGAPSPCPFDSRTAISGILINAVGILPIGDRWFLDARTGIGKMKVKTNDLATSGPGRSVTSDGFHYALGGGYRIGDHWEVLLDYGAYEQLDFGLTLGGRFGVYNLGETTMTSLGVNYRW